MKDIKSKTVINAFIELVNEFNCKPNKLWVHLGMEFYDILMYSTHNESKSVVAERFIKTLKAKIYEKMTANDSKS